MDDWTADMGIGALSSREMGKIHFLINLSSVERILKLNIGNEKKKWCDILSGKLYNFSNGPGEIRMSPWKTIILTQVNRTYP